MKEIRRKMHGQVLATPAWSHGTWRKKKGETGIMLNSGPLLRGHGYAVEALDLVFALGFDHLKLEKIELGTDKDNVPMQSLMEKRFGVKGGVEGEAGRLVVHGYSGVVEKEAGRKGRRKSSYRRRGFR